MAYVVGSASVEIVPDFRNAQRKITAFFEGQGNNVKVPVDFEVDRASAARLREEVLRNQQQAAEASKNSIKAVSAAEREAHAENTRRIRERTLLEQRAAAERVKLEDAADKQAAENAARIRQRSLADEERQRRAYLERAGQTRARIEEQYVQRSAELTRRELFDREEHYNKLYDQIDKRQRDSDALAAKLAAVQAQRDKAQRERNAQVSALGGGGSGRVNYTSDFDGLARAQIASANHAANERLRIEESTLSQTQLLRVRALRDQERAESESLRRIAAERQEDIRQATLLRQQGNGGNGVLNLGPLIESETDSAGARGGKSLSNALLNNFKQEIRTRATFIGAVLAAAFIAGAPALLAVGPVLFGAIGLAATANASEVKEAWKSTWQSILADTRSGASSFVSVHTQLAASTRAAFLSVRPAIDEAFSAAAPQTERFGNALLQASTILIGGFNDALQKSSPVMTGFGDLVVKTSTGLSEMLGILANDAPAAGSSMSALGDIFGEILPLLGQVLAVGAEFAGSTLPLLTAAFSALNSAMSLVAPVLPLIAAGFTALKLGGLAATGIGALAGRMGALSVSLQSAATSGVGFTRGAGALANGASRIAGGLGAASSAVGGMGAALPLLGVAIALVASEMNDAEQQEKSWTQGILEGGQAAATAAEQVTAEREKYGDGWLGQLSYDTDAFFGLASSMDDATEAADEQLAAMTPLQRAQTLATQAVNDLAFATEEYGAGSREARGAAEENETAQRNLATAQREANIVLRDTVSSADAAKAAMEDYQAAILNGDTAGQTEALARYREEVAESANDTRLLNAATADTVSSADAASAALEDFTVALRNGDTEGAAESMSRYKRETSEAAYEQSDLEDALYGTNEALEAQRDLTRAAADSGFAFRQAQLDLASAQETYAEAMADGTLTAEEHAQAQLDLETALNDVATAAGDLAADELPATATELDRSRANSDAYLQQLYLLRDQMGSAFPASLQTTITNLENTRGNMDFARTAAGLLRESVFGIPTSRTTTITADTSSAEARIQSFLSRKWTADIVVTADMRAQGGYYADRAYGGPIDGYSPHDRADNVLVNTTAGEFVTQRPSVRKYGMPFMYAVNSGLFPTELAMAGLSALGSNSFERAANNDRQSFATGGLILPDKVISYNANLDGATKTAQDFINLKASQAAASGGPAGASAIGGGWQSIAKIVQAAIPQARINSTYRPGDPGYHGRGKAVDFGFGGVPGGAGSQGLAKIASFLYSGYGRTLAELIYDGIYDNTPDVKNGRDHTYNSGTRAEHRNHVHAAVYDWGGALMPGLNLMMNNTGATEYLSNNTAAINGFREMLGASGGMAMPRFNVGAMNSGRGVGGNDMRSVTGFVNNGTIITQDVEELGRQAETSKRESLASLGLI